MDSQNYRPRLLIILVLAVVIGQVLAVNFIRKDFEQKIAQCYEAVNTNSVLQGALVNILIERGVMQREELLQEAQKLSADLLDKYEMLKKSQNQVQDTSENNDTTR